MRYLIDMIILALVLTIGVASVSADTIYPSDDMYTDPEFGGSNPAEQIWVANFPAASNYQRLMMRFDLEAYMGRTVDTAVLHMYRFFGCPSGGVTGTIMYDISVDWDEDTWPETVHINHGDTEYGYYNFSVNGWHEMDVTDMIQAWLDGDIVNYGFVLGATPGSKFSKFYSKEANQSYRPYLELTTITDIEDDRNSLPEQLTLGAYPNPFNASTNIEYSLPEAADVAIEIYNILGHKVEELVNGYQQAGYYHQTWNAGEYPSGIYFVNINAGTMSSTRKMVLVK